LHFHKKKKLKNEFKTTIGTIIKWSDQ